MSRFRKSADPLVSVGDNLPTEFRWFREIDNVHERHGLWHVGPVPAGKTWPAGAGLCGVAAPAAEIGSHETAIVALTHRSDLCPACVAIFRTRFGGFIG
jgi:hypothetical protein